MLKAEALSRNLFAQATEIKALIEALKLAKGKVANIFTDSKYAFEICHATGKLWREHRFVTASGKKVAHGDLINELLEVIGEPERVAIIHCRGHQKGLDNIAKGNQRADKAAKEAALKTPIQAPLLILTCNIQEFKIAQKKRRNSYCRVQKKRKGD